jgi:hypothetical protein
MRPHFGWAEEFGQRLHDAHRGLVGDTVIDCMAFTPCRHNAFVT